VNVDDRPSNRLADQHSAYLRAHSHDPVNWRPWGAKAFKRAVKLDRPIFLSIGYESCHWCHVMQRESFQDPDISGFLNRQFVCVKVDRELRPDIDTLYQMYVGTVTGSGGWPLSAFLLPDGSPFFGGTYFPKTSPRPEMPGFGNVMASIMQAWVLERDTAFKTGTEAIEFLREMRAASSAPIGPTEVAGGIEAIRPMLDPLNGGLGTAPKFPQTAVIDLLLTAYESDGADWQFEAARDWVRAIIRGGLFDHVGGGVFRYATDSDWTIPHFEKMLPDQGLLLSTLARIHRIEPAEEYRVAARMTADMLARDLADPNGGFFSSLDADTAGTEGTTYVWTIEELAAALDEPQLELARRHLGVVDEGIWHGRTNVLTRRGGRDHEADEVDGVLRVLAVARALRAQPPVIENNITAYNAQVARGLIEAGAAFEDADMSSAGTSALDWLLGTAARGDEVVRSPEDGSVASLRFLEDHSAVVAACLSAIEFSGRDELLKRAAAIHARAIKLFSDDAGFVMSTGDTALPFSPIETADAPGPAAASVLAENAVRLAQLTDTPGHTEIAERATRQFGRTASMAPHLAANAIRVALIAGQDGVRKNT
jgi:hypothetical protein